MFPPARYEQWIRRAAWIAVVLAAVVGIILVYASLRLPVPSDAFLVGEAARPIPMHPGPLAGHWEVLRSADGEAPSDATMLSRRFRLAGTYFPYGSEAEDDRRAVLEDLQERAEEIVKEGEKIGSVEVVRILRDGVVLRQGGVVETLWLSFSNRGRSGAGDGGEDVVAGGDGIVRDPGNRFGGQVGEQKWVFSREALLDYYAELLDAPERLLIVFDSLKPLYDEHRNITGYVLGMEGEGDFFEAVGLRQGDVVRQVNSLPMTNRRRAEYFIREFAEDRANAFVLDIERDGKPTKLIYQVR